jgi:hypothetical protein
MLLSFASPHEHQHGNDQLPTNIVAEVHLNNGEISTDTPYSKLDSSVTEDDIIEFQNIIQSTRLQIAMEMG